MGVGCAAAVVERADDDGAVRVALHKGDEHLLAQARGVVAAPVGAGPGLGDAHPSARAGVGRGIAASGVAEAVAAALAALPVKLHLDAQIAVSVHGLGQAHDDGRLCAMHLRAGEDHIARGR